MKEKQADWKNAVMRLILGYESGALFTSDHLRVKAAEAKLKDPAHPNAWGGVILAAKQRGFITKTGRYFPSGVPSNHSAIVAEWRRT